MNTEKLESAKTLIQEFLDENTVHAEQAWKLNSVKKDVADLIKDIDFSFKYGA